MSFCLIDEHNVAFIRTFFYIWLQALLSIKNQLLIEFYPNFQNQTKLVTLNMNRLQQCSKLLWTLGNSNKSNRQWPDEWRWYNGNATFLYVCITNLFEWLHFALKSLILNASSSSSSSENFHIWKWSVEYVICCTGEKTWTSRNKSSGERNDWTFLQLL